MPDYRNAVLINLLFTRSGQTHPSAAYFNRRLSVYLSVTERLR